MDPRKVILLLGLTPLCVLAQAPDVKSGIEHLQKLDSIFLQDESVVVKSGTSDAQAVKPEVSKPEAVNNKKNSSQLDLDSLKQGSLKSSRPVAAVNTQAVGGKAPESGLSGSNAPENTVRPESIKTPEEVSVNIPAPPEIRVESVKSSETEEHPKADPEKMIADAKAGMGSSEHKREVKVTAAPVTKNAALNTKKPVQKQSVKRVAVAADVNTLRDQNGAVNRVHNGLDDVTASDLAASKPLQSALPKSPWEAEVRQISGYDPNRPPLPDGRTLPSISDLSSEIDPAQAPGVKRVSPKRNYDLARKMTVFSRKDSFNVATQAPSQNEINEKRLLETAPRSGSARIPDVSGLVRN